MLPVYHIAARLVAALKLSGCVVLTAPTGSGKSTQVPRIVFESGIMPANEQIIVLQPRRLATRMVAARVAFEMKTTLGGLVGYQTRYESAVSNATRIRFMTEGLLLRLLQGDSTLKGVGCVILDEFHERNLPADISLALLKQLQSKSRSDLRIMVMSATLDAKAVAQYLDCEALETGGRLHPVHVRYLPKPPAPGRDQPWDLAASVLESIVEEDGTGETPVPPHSRGDVLIFMPGAYEIARTIEACEKRSIGSSPPLRFFPLHGSLPPREQDEAVSPCAGVRKVIVATNVAETSITIDGITAVIDSGLARIHRFDPKRGLNALRIEPISKASADQRAGRAGRTAPGVCVRLWTTRDHCQRADHDAPEVHRLELSEALLQLKSMGHAQSDDAAFDWLTPPTTESVQRAESLLRELEAEDAAGSLTPLGHTMAEFPAHPRLARFMIEASKRGCLRRAIVWAAIINERDIFTQPQARILARYAEQGEPASDIAAIEHAFDDLKQGGFNARRCGENGASVGACRDVDRTAAQFAAVCRRLRLTMDGGNRTSDLIASLLPAYRDHLAVKLESQRPHCAMPGRRKVALDKESLVKDAGPLLALEMSEVGRGDTAPTMLSLASTVEIAVLESNDPAGFDSRNELQWNSEQKLVECVESRGYRGLTLERTARPPHSSADKAAASAMIAEKIIAGELNLELWNDKVEQWITRARCVAKWFPEKQLIAYDADDLRVIVHEIVGEAVRFSQVRDRPVMVFVRNALDWEQQRFVEKMAPESMALPRGWHMKIEYGEGDPPPPPKGRAKIQDLYDLDDTPRIAGGRVPLLLEILGPNFRPVQVTSDLKGFWTNLYPELKKHLKRRYPRHEWR